jgi:RAQPRD family integrative conjugative element protein
MRSMHGLGGHFMRVSWRVGLVLLVGLIAPATVLADADAEREVLARLIHEIEALGPLIETAEAQAILDARIRFRYEWLRQDLSRIRAGIQDHIDAPRAEPRAFPPLRGDYRQ